MLRFSGDGTMLGRVTKKTRCSRVSKGYGFSLESPNLIVTDLASSAHEQTGSVPSFASVSYFMKLQLLKLDVFIP